MKVVYEMAVIRLTAIMRIIQTDRESLLDVVRVKNYNSGRREKSRKERKTEKIRIQVEIEKCPKQHEIYEKNRQDIKTPRKRLFVRIF